jgi:hypothetical protein
MTQSADTVAVSVHVDHNKNVDSQPSKPHDVSGGTITPRYLHVTPVAKILTYPRMVLLPIYVTMTAFGFIYRKECRADVRIIYYLFFGGLSGLISTSLRLLMIFKWRIIRSQYHQSYNATEYPGFQMVSSCSTLFCLLVFIWNMFATYYMAHINPNFDPSSLDNYCELKTYLVAYVIVAVLNCVFVIYVLVWLSSMIMILCVPEIFSDFFYEENILPVDIHFRIPIWLKDTEVIPELKKKLSTVPNDEAKGSRTEFNVTVAVNGDIYLTPASPDKELLIKIWPK